MFRALATLILVAVPSASVAADVSFERDVMALLSRAGCNMGACHGNLNGKGGFKLSLRGQDSDADFATLTRDMLGRRLDRLRPADSLVLAKASMTLAHEGGQRFGKGSAEFHLLRRWIAQGARLDPPGTPRPLRIEVSPAEAILHDPA